MKYKTRKGCTFDTVEIKWYSVNKQILSHIYPDQNLSAFRLTLV